MRRLCVVRSEGDPRPIACSQIIHVKANPYEKGSPHYGFVLCEDIYAVADLAAHAESSVSGI